MGNYFKRQVSDDLSNQGGFFHRQSHEAVVRWVWKIAFWAVLFNLLLCVFIYQQTRINQVLIACLEGSLFLALTYSVYSILKRSRPEMLGYLLLIFIALSLISIESNWLGLTLLIVIFGGGGIFLIAYVVLPGRRWFPAGVVVLFILSIWYINSSEGANRLPVSQQPIIQAVAPIQIILIFLISLFELTRTFEFYIIRDRLWAFFALNTLMVTAIITITVALINWNREIKQSVAQLETIATFKEIEMDNWITQAQLVLDVGLSRQENTCLLATVQKQANLCPFDPYEELFVHLFAINEATSFFDELFLMNRNGMVIVSTRPDQEGKVFANRLFFTAGLNGKYVDSPSYNPALGRISIILSRPIIGTDGQVIGVIAGRANMNQINQIILDPKQFDSTNNIYLLNANSIALTHPAGIVIENLTNVYIRSLGTQRVLESHTDGSALYNDYQNIPVIGVYHWLDTLQIALIVEQYQHDAFVLAYQTIITNLIIAVVAVLIDIVITLFITRTITTPINNLAQTASSIAAGNLLLTAPITSQDEIGNLALAFNSMTSQLRIVIRDLDQRFQELQQAQEKIRQSEEYQRALIEHTSDAIIIINADTRIRFVSPAIQRMLNYSPEELKGRLAIELVHPDDLEAAMSRLAELLHSRGELMSLELRVRHQDQSWRIIELVGRNLLADSIVNGLVLNARDISERKQVEEALLQTQKLESIGLLAGGVAHDFNNLLTSLMAQTSLALLKLGPTNPAYIHIERAISSAQRAADLTRQLLAYAGKGHFESHIVDLNALILENVGLFETALSKKVSLERNLADDLPTFAADRGQIQQVVMNLVINAGEAIMADSGRVIITTYPKIVTDDEHIMVRPGREMSVEPGLYVCLEISDTGIGMDKETIERIFDPFFSTKGGGRGLGLSATLGIIGSHKGSLHLQSQPGQGTTFQILFPAIHANARPPSITSPDMPALLPVHQLTVLVIDDEEPVRDAIADILEAEGVSVLTAIHGQDGLLSFQANQTIIDVVLLDMQMPVMNGEQTLQALRQLNPYVKIILSSGYSESEVISRFSSDGLTTFLQKPYQVDKLIAHIRQILV